MHIKRICSRLHLWLGLISGIIVFVVCATGALCSFRDEIEDATQPWRFVEAQRAPILPPERLIAVANRAAGEHLPYAITYGEPTDAAKVDYFAPSGDAKAVYLNPYNGRVIRVVKRGAGDFDFFDFLMRGHLSLWLPRAVGGPIVSYGVLAFLIVLITGLVIWWPRRWSRKALHGRLTIRRPWRRVRVAIDLHNVIGFYALLPLIVLCLTGMMFGLPWFSRAVYGIVSGGHELQAYAMPASDTVDVDTTRTASLDRLYDKVRREAPAAKNFYFTLPQTAADIYRVSVVHERGSYYRTDNLYYDRYTLAPLQGQGPWAGRYDRVSAADQMMRANLEVHDGRIFGLVGKAIMCLAALIGASLPVTGFIMWRRRHKARRRSPRA